MKKYKSKKEKAILFFKGFSMGSADIVPGVSGGTIALIAGIYDHFISAISSIGLRHARAALQIVFLWFHPEKRKKPISLLKEIPFDFLLPLMFGILSAILSVSHLIPYLMENYALPTFSIFFGLILYSISVPLRRMNIRLIEILILFIFATAVFWFSSFSPLSKAVMEINIENNSIIKVYANDQGKFTVLFPSQKRAGLATLYERSGKSLGRFQWSLDPERPHLKINEVDLPGFLIESPAGKIQQKENSLQVPFSLIKKSSTDFLNVFSAGAVAICAMVLPGISGAYILVILGQYKNILLAIAERDIAILGFFIAGIFVGLFGFIRILKWLLVRYHSFTMAALTGLMVGSLRRIWPLDFTTEATNYNVLITMFFFICLGALFVYGLEIISKKLNDPEPPV